MDIDNFAKGAFINDVIQVGGIVVLLGNYILRCMLIMLTNAIYVSMVPGGDERLLYDPALGLRDISCIPVQICRGHFTECHWPFPISVYL